MKPSDLQLNVHEIPEAGITLDGTLPAEWAAESLLDAYRAESPLTLTLEVERMGENVLVRGKAEVALAYECSRTLQPAQMVLKAPFAELFVEGEKHHHNLAEHDISSDDLEDEPWLIENGKIDLEALVREALVLAQDPYPLAPGVARDGADDAPAETPLWSSGAGEVDPRWERLKNIKLD